MYECKPKRSKRINRRETQDGVEWIHHPDLQCWVERIEYDFRSKIGTIHMREGSRTSMKGAIQLFLSIDAAVVEIKAYDGESLDIRYVRETGHWWNTISQS